MKEEDIVYYGSLLEIYGNMLTNKQQKTLIKLYNMDLSLSEIAQEDNISRQAVRDIILKGIKKLDEFEKNLKIYENFKKEDGLLGRIDKNILSLNAMIETISLNEQDKNKLDDYLKKIVKDVESLKKI